MTPSETDPSTEDVLVAPGYLLTPLAWVRSELVPLIAREPDLAVHIVTLDRARMHLVAFAFANMTSVMTPTFIRAVCTECRRRALSTILGEVPAGLGRLFKSMPYRVMPRETYTRVAVLASDTRAGRLLSHAENVDENVIDLLWALPPVLRCPAILRLSRSCHVLDGLPAALHFLAARGGIDEADTFARRLSRCRNPREFAAIVRNVAEVLSLPETLPPKRLGGAVRIEDPHQIRDLARRWRNCLAGYISAIDGGECAFYLWQSDDVQVGCLVRRRGRLGWFLDEIKGPGNREPSDEVMREIVDAFAGAGVPKIAIAEVIDELCSAAEGGRRRRRGAAPEAELDDIEATAAHPEEQIDPDAVEECESDLLDAIICNFSWTEESHSIETVQDSV